MTRVYKVKKQKMISNKCMFLVLAVTLSLSLLLHTCSATSRILLRKLHDCPQCDMSLCPPLPFDYECEPVLEPGVCGCCLRCARQLGDNCGFQAGRCSKGYTCLPPPGSLDIYQAYTDGTAICTDLNSVIL